MEQTSHVQKGVVEPDSPDEIERFMASREGWKLLNHVRRYLTGSTIVGVKFYPTDKGITTHLLLSEREYFEFNGEMFSHNTLREQFGSVFRRFAAKAKE